MIESVAVQRFKCLEDVRVAVGPFNVLIGPNDSGKSSFLQAIAEPTGWEQNSPRFVHLGIDAFRRKPAVLLAGRFVALGIETDDGEVAVTVQQITDSTP